jgi:hypothetical protein
MTLLAAGAVVNCTALPLHCSRKPRSLYSSSNARSKPETAAGEISNALPNRPVETGPLATNKMLSNKAVGLNSFEKDSLIFSISASQLVSWSAGL